MRTLQRYGDEPMDAPDQRHKPPGRREVGPQAKRVPPATDARRAVHALAPTARPAHLLRLQRLVGNRALQRLLSDRRSHPQPGVIQRMTRQEADNLDPTRYPYENLTSAGRTYTADGRPFWKFFWYRGDNNQTLEIHVHGDPGQMSAQDVQRLGASGIQIPNPGFSITGINVRWAGGPGNPSVNPAPYWIQDAIQRKMVGIQMGLPNF